MKHVKSEYNPLETEPLQMTAVQPPGAACSRETSDSEVRAESIRGVPRVVVENVRRLWGRGQGAQSGGERAAREGECVDASGGG